MFRPGQPIVVRALDHLARPLIGIPVTVVEDRPDLVAVHLPIGIRMQWFADAELGGPRGRSILRWNGEHEERLWQGNELLILKRPGDRHSIHVIWRPGDREFLGWYVNLEEPSRRTSIGFDARDLELDIVIAPDLSWHWKDEDEFEWAIGSGRIPAERGGAIRAEGERAVERVIRREFPLDRAWETWRPDPAWNTPILPHDWEIPSVDET